MRKRIVPILVVLVVIAAALGAFAWWSLGHIGVERLTDDVYVMTGIGGNAGVLVTTAGVVVVDTMTFPRQGAAILKRIHELTDQRVIAILNTHYHSDHTHGNPAFEPGTKVIATDRTLTHLKERDADFWRDPPASALLPNETFDHTHELRLGNKTVRSFHLGRGHTDGDLVVLFVEDRVLQMGDLFFNGYYPNIDLAAGGSVEAWPATIQHVFDLTLDFDRVIPGHGPVSTPEGFRTFQEFMQSLWSQTSAVAQRGGTLADALREVDLARFDLGRLIFARHLNREFVIGRAYEEASGRPR